MDTNREVGEEPLDPSSDSRTASMWVDEHFGIRACRHDEIFLPQQIDRGHGSGVLSIRRVEDGDEDTRIKYYLTSHSLLSFFRYPFGYFKVPA